MSTLLNTRGSEDATIACAVHNVDEILGGLRAIIERLDGVIEERNDRISELEAEVDRLRGIIQEMP